MIHHDYEKKKKKKVYTPKPVYTSRALMKIHYYLTLLTGLWHDTQMDNSNSYASILRHGSSTL